MNPPPPQLLPNEKDLFVRMAGGDESAFGIIFFHYTARIKPFLTNLTGSESVAEELIQEIFLNLWLNRAKMGEIGNYQAYIFTASNNRLYTWLKRRARQLHLQQELAENLPDPAQNPEETVHLKECMAIIEHAVERLPPQKKLIWRLSRGKGLSHEEISLQLGLSKNTIKNHLVAAIRIIRGHLNDQREDVLIIVLMLETFIKISRTV